MVITIDTMPTTIQVSDLTKQRLQAIKERKHAASYEQVIVEFMDKEVTAQSGFGIFPGMRWSKADRPKDREL